MSAKVYYEWLAASIGQYEVLSRSLVQHRAEKGRVVEGVVKAALRSILPGRFSLGTGFVVAASQPASPQLDVIVYDALHNAPIILEGGVGLFPVECVYAVIEVKSALDKGEITRTTKMISKVRNLACEKRYEAYAGAGETDRPVSIALAIHDSLPPRSYVFALRSKLSNEKLLETLQQQATENDAHIHGLAVIEGDLFASQRPYTKPCEFEASTGNVMTRFGACVLQGVQSFPMGPAAMSQYLGQ